MSAIDAVRNSRAIPSLDGIRAVAMMLVIFHHSGVPFVNGGSGVLIFFVLSGFLITWLLLQEEKSRGNISLKQFYIRRTLRILPSFYVYCLLFIILLLVTARPVPWPQAIASVLYAGNYFQALTGYPSTALSHTWSLAVEEQFYILWPLAFILLRNNRRRVLVMGCAIVVVWVYRLLLILGSFAPSSYAYYALDTRADHLLAGCITAVALRAGIAPAFWKAATARKYSLWLTLFLLGTSTVLPFCIGWWYRDIIGYIVDPVLTAILIVQSVTFYDTTAAWLNWGWMKFLGRVSYSMYLYHQLVLHPVIKAMSAWHIPGLEYLVGFLAITAAGTVFYYLVEFPCAALKDRWGKRKPEPSPIAASVAA